MATENGGVGRCFRQFFHDTIKIYYRVTFAALNFTQHPFPTSSLLSMTHTVSDSLMHESAGVRKEVIKRPRNAEVLRAGYGGLSRSRHRCRISLFSSGWYQYATLLPSNCAHGRFIPAKSPTNLSLNSTRYSNPTTIYAQCHQPSIGHAFSFPVLTRSHRGGDRYREPGSLS